MQINNLIYRNVLKRENIKKKRLETIIFTRACCCIGIVIFHYFTHSNGNFKILYMTANSSFGYLFVTVFFCISGAVLYYNYPNIISFKEFYFKRWKSIFPSYYICFLYFYLRNVLIFRKLFYNGHWSKLFLTLIGLDGYLSYKIKTYYVVGDWFIGPIVIIYILYPLLLKIHNKNWLIVIIIIVYYFLLYKTNIFIISNGRNIITCIISFYFGMKTINHKNIFFENKKAFMISFILFGILYIVNIKYFILIYQIQGFSLYIILVQIGKYIMIKKINKIFKQIDIISYSIYLFHHRIIIDILSITNPSIWYLHLILLNVAIILTIICSKIHLYVVNSVINYYVFRKFESLFI